MATPPADCPICLDEMDEADSKYPLPCPSECGYNFCVKCVNHLVTSAKCDYETASDGSRQVKIKLQCPQCRGNIKDTIHDTLLMRRASKAAQYTNLPDSQLNATELRIKHEFSTEDAQAVRDAEARLRKFQSMDVDSLNMEGYSSANGAEEKEKSDFPVDITLFNGLECSMSEAEQSYVSQLMISGDANQLAQAAEILHSIAQMSLKGTTPSMKLAVKKEVIELTRAERLVEKTKLEQFEKKKKRNPLPARMPRYAVLKAFKPNKRKSPLSFIDDEWDGSIADAFSRVRTAKNSPGIEKIISLADNPYIASATTRIKINYVKGEAGRLGLQSGDIATHINGEVLEENADGIDQLIRSLYDENSEDPQTFTIVVNAEPSTAEVLRLRSQAWNGKEQF